MSWTTLKSLFFLCLAMQVGCVQLRDRVDECLITSQDNKLTEKAWRDHRHFWVDQPFQKDFRKGFKAGHSAGLDGEDCPPAIPPRYYWSAANSGPNAEMRTKAWFDGWWMGSVAATTEGLHNHRRVHVAPHIQASKAEPEIDWSKVTEEMREHLPLVPIPEVPMEETPQELDGKPPVAPPLVPPAVPPAKEPKKDPAKEYNPRVTRPELYLPIQ